MTQNGRPGLLIGVWMLLLGVLAAALPLTQAAVGFPWEVLQLIMLGPALAVGVLWFVARSWFPRWWTPVAWREMAVPIGLALLFAAIYLAVLVALGGRMPSLPGNVLGFPIAVYLILAFVGALGEEVGWRGLMQRAGEEYASKWIVAVVVGFLFGVTHLGMWGAGPWVMLGFGLSTVFLQVAMVALWRGGFWQRMIPCTIIHGLMNISAFAVAADFAAASPLLLPVPTLIACAVVAPLGVRLNRRPDHTDSAPLAVAAV